MKTSAYTGLWLPKNPANVKHLACSYTLYMFNEAKEEGSVHRKSFYSSKSSQTSTASPLFIVDAFRGMRITQDYADGQFYKSDNYESVWLVVKDALNLNSEKLYSFWNDEVPWISVWEKLM